MAGLKPDTYKGFLAVLIDHELATRTALLPLDEIEAEFRRLAVLVQKTGGEREGEERGARGAGHGTVSLFAGLPASATLACPAGGRK